MKNIMIKKKSIDLFTCYFSSSIIHDHLTSTIIKNTDNIFWIFEYNAIRCILNQARFLTF